MPDAAAQSNSQLLNRLLAKAAKGILLVGLSQGVVLILLVNMLPAREDLLKGWVSEPCLSLRSRTSCKENVHGLYLGKKMGAGK
ncbi:MAG: hypothetical protein ACK5T6_20715 [Pirellula sp.]